MYTNHNVKYFLMTQHSTSTKQTHTLNARGSSFPGSTVCPVARLEGIQSPCAQQSQVWWHGACHWLSAPSLWAGSPLGDSALGQLPSRPNSAICSAYFKFVYYTPYARTHHVYTPYTILSKPLLLKGMLFLLLFSLHLHTEWSTQWHTVTIALKLFPPSSRCTKPESFLSQFNTQTAECSDNRCDFHYFK